MVEPDGELQHAHDLRAAQRPAAPEHQVVNVLHAHAGERTNEVQRVQMFLQIEEMNVPGAILGINDGLQCRGGAAMAAAGVKIDELDSAHPLQILSCGVKTTLITIL